MQTLREGAMNKRAAGPRRVAVGVEHCIHAPSAKVERLKADCAIVDSCPRASWVTLKFSIRASGTINY